MNVKEMFLKSKSKFFIQFLFHINTIYSNRFLKFFYTAKVTLHESIVIGLLCLADKYNVQS
jgi:hypothetical protein